MASSPLRHAEEVASAAVSTSATPILLAGAGALGGALLEGWRIAGAVEPAQLLIRDPTPKAAALAAAEAGAALNPPDGDLSHAQSVVLAMKPQGWRAAATALAPLLAADAVIVSVLAGVHAEDIADAFGGRSVVRVMPTTAIGIARGVATVHAADAEARARAHALFDPVATVVDLEDEALLDAATGVSGSAPAYLYAFTESLAAAGVSAGLPAETAARLARATVESAAALMAQSPLTPAELRAQVTSPNGVTQAALDVLLSGQGLPALMRDAVTAAVRRSRELGEAASKA